MTTNISFDAIVRALNYDRDFYSETEAWLEQQSPEMIDMLCNDYPYCKETAYIAGTEDEKRMLLINKINLYAPPGFLSNIYVFLPPFITPEESAEQICELQQSLNAAYANFNGLSILENELLSRTFDNPTTPSYATELLLLYLNNNIAFCVIARLFAISLDRFDKYLHGKISGTITMRDVSATNARLLRRDQALGDDTIEPEGDEQHDVYTVSAPSLYINGTQRNNTPVPEEIKNVVDTYWTPAYNKKIKPIIEEYLPLLDEKDPVDTRNLSEECRGQTQPDDSTGEIFKEEKEIIRNAIERANDFNKTREKGESPSPSDIAADFDIINKALQLSFNQQIKRAAQIKPENIRALMRAKQGLMPNQGGGGICMSRKLKESARIPNESDIRNSMEGNIAAYNFLLDLSEIFKLPYSNIDPRAMPSAWQLQREDSIEIQRARAPWTEVFVTEMHKATESYLARVGNMLHFLDGTRRPATGNQRYPYAWEPISSRNLYGMINTSYQAKFLAYTFKAYTKIFIKLQSISPTNPVEDEEDEPVVAAEGDVEGDAEGDSSSHELSNIPSPYKDPITLRLMKNPVILPNSKINVDASTISKLSGKDPFNRAPLGSPIPNESLQQAIETWRKQQLPITGGRSNKYIKKTKSKHKIKTKRNPKSKRKIKTKRKPKSKRKIKTKRKKVSLFKS